VVQLALVKQKDNLYWQLAASPQQWLSSVGLEKGYLGLAEAPPAEMTAAAAV
jgi:hypothetical protein